MLRYVVCVLCIMLAACSRQVDVALIEAAGEGNVSKVERLIAEGANLNVAALDG
jgi:hypothetical protein